MKLIGIGKRPVTKKDWIQIGLTIVALGFSGTTALMVYKLIRKEDLFPLLQFKKKKKEIEIQKPKENENTTDTTDDSDTAR